MCPRPPTSPLFPYTTLFRSVRESIRSRTASACVKSSRPFRKALIVNSPSSAGRAGRVHDEGLSERTAGFDTGGGGSGPDRLADRSEERRVGEEGRGRWARAHSEANK